MKKNEKREEIIKKLIPYIEDLIGDRTLRKASEDTGITAAYLSGILKGKYLPSAEILRKLTETNAFPQNGVTLEDLMVAAGYQDDYMVNLAPVMPVDYYVPDKEDSGVVIEQVKRSDPESQKLRRLSVRHTVIERQREVNRYKNIATALIISEMGERFYDFKRVAGTHRCVKGYRPGLILEIYRQMISEWWIDFRFFPRWGSAGEGVHIHKMSRAPMVFSVLFHLPPDEKRKMSFAINDPELFRELEERAGQIAFRGELSIILINDKEGYIEKEVYLSNYWEGKKDAEFYIVE